VIRPGKPVLVVEDHEDTRHMVEMFLLLDGYDVVSASNGAEALEFVARVRPCLILLDVNMPIMDGPAFARRLRAHPDRTLADTPIVLLTAVPNASELQKEIGAVDALSKPISFDRVMELVAHYYPFPTPL
jgi:CheY-like chemotaxis protein